MSNIEEKPYEAGFGTKYDPDMHGKSVGFKSMIPDPEEVAAPEELAAEGGFPVVEPVQTSASVQTEVTPGDPAHE